MRCVYASAETTLADCVQAKDSEANTILPHSICARPPPPPLPPQKYTCGLLFKRASSPAKSERAVKIIDVPIDIFHDASARKVYMCVCVCVHDSKWSTETLNQPTNPSTHEPVSAIVRHNNADSVEHARPTHTISFVFVRPARPRFEF